MKSKDKIDPEDTNASDAPLLTPSKPTKEHDQTMFDPSSDPPTTTTMFKTFIALAVPAMLTNLAGMTTNIVSLIFAGHMSDPTNLAAHALAFSSNSILVKSLLVGLNAA